MRIEQFKNKNLNKAAELFSKSYSTKNRQWTRKSSKSHINEIVSSFPEYAFEAVNDEGISIGYIFCSIQHNFDELALFIDSIQIDPSFRRKGIGDRLLKHAIYHASKNGIKNIMLLSDTNNPITKKWYESIGFRQTGWVEYELNVNVD